MPAYPFLSDEWFVEVRRVLDEGAVAVPDRHQPPREPPGHRHAVRRRPAAPHRDRPTAAPTGTTATSTAADLTITTDYTTARELFIAGDPQGALQALMEGKLKLQGDLTKLMARSDGGNRSGLTRARRGAGRDHVLSRRRSRAAPRRATS